MANAATLVVQILADSSKATQEINQVAQGFAKMGSKISSGLKGLAGGFAVGSFGKEIISAASDMEQSLGGVEAIFKDSSSTIEAWAADSTDNFRVPAQAANEFATSIGNSLKQAGRSTDEAATEVQKLGQVGADLAAVYGGSTVDAIDAVNAAISKGEWERLESFGVTVKQADISAEMNKIAGGADKITAANRGAIETQARINVLMREAGPALGGAASEADTFAAKMDAFKEKWANFKAEMGKALLAPAGDIMSGVMDLLPQLTPLIQRLVDLAASLMPLAGLTLKLVGALAQLPTPILAVGAALAGWAKYGDKLTGFFSNLSTGVKGMGAGVKAATGVTGKLSAGLGGLMGLAGGPLGIGLAAAGAAFVYFSDKAADAAAASKAIQDEVNSLIDTFSKGLPTESTAEGLSKIVSGARDELVKLGVIPGDIVAAVMKGGDSLQGMRKQIVDNLDIKELGTHLSNQAADLTDFIASAMDTSGEAIVRMVAEGGPALEELRQHMLDSGISASRVEDYFNSVRNTLEQSSPAYKAVSEAVRSYTEGSKKSSDEAKTAAEVAKTNATAQTAVSKSYYDVASGAVVSEQALASQKAAQTEAAAAAKAHAEAQRDLKKRIEEATHAVELHVKSAEQMFENTDASKMLATLDTVEQKAQRSAEVIKAALDNAFPQRGRFKDSGASAMVESLAEIPKLLAQEDIGGKIADIFKKIPKLDAAGLLKLGDAGSAVRDWAVGFQAAWDQSVTDIFVKSGGNVKTATTQILAEQKSLITQVAGQLKIPESEAKTIVESITGPIDAATLQKKVLEIAAEDQAAQEKLLFWQSVKFDPKTQTFVSDIQIPAVEEITQKLNEKYGLVTPAPVPVPTTPKVPEGAGAAAASQLQGQVDQHPVTTTVKVNPPAKESFSDQSFGKFYDTKVTITPTVNPEPANKAVQGIADTTAKTEAELNVDANTSAADRKLRSLTSANYKATVDVGANTSKASSAINTIMRSRYSTTVGVGANTSSFQTVIGATTRASYRTTVDIYGNTSPLQQTISALQQNSYSITVAIKADTTQFYSTFNSLPSSRSIAAAPTPPPTAPPRPGGGPQTTATGGSSVEKVTTLNLSVQGFVGSEDQLARAVQKVLRDRDRRVGAVIV
jgi:hypothetical protein